MLEQVQNAFQQAQKSATAQRRLVSALLQLSTPSQSEFQKAFFFCLRHVLATKRKSVEVERVVRFIHSFLTQLSSQRGN
jgi:hypothetical protein